MSKNKLKSARALKKIIPSLKKRKKKVVFTNGCFDILHKGHIKLLKKSKSLGDVLVVAVNSDSSIKKIKGPKRPINPLRDRILILSAIDSVDFITVFNESTPAKVIREISPDVLVKGGDWKRAEIVGSNFIEAKGGRVYSVPLERGYSTSNLIKKIARRFK